MKKIIKLLICILCFTFNIILAGNITLSAEANPNSESVDTEELDLDEINSIVDESIKEFNERISTYSELSSFSFSSDEPSEIIYQNMKDTVVDIYNDLDEESKEALNDLREESTEVDNLVSLLDNNFENVDEIDCSCTIENEITQFDSIEELLTYCNVCKEAFISIVGTLKIAWNTFKAWFITNKAKICIITACLLTLTVVMISIWDSIKPYFNQFIELCVNSLISIAEPIIKVFDAIKLQIYLLQVDVDSLKADVDISDLQIPGNDRIYYIAYVDKGLIIMSKYPLSYLEAATVLAVCGFVNLSDYGFQLLSEYSGIQKVIDELTQLNIKDGLIGIYTDYKMDAARLAVLYGGLESTTPKVHGGGLNAGYLYHFHDANHMIHVWYKYA